MLDHNPWREKEKKNIDHETSSTTMPLTHLGEQFFSELKKKSLLNFLIELAGSVGSIDPSIRQETATVHYRAELTLLTVAKSGNKR